jgi:hypothetical protein
VPASPLRGSDVSDIGHCSPVFPKGRRRDARDRSDLVLCPRVTALLDRSVETPSRDGRRFLADHHARLLGPNGELARSTTNAHRQFKLGGVAIDQVTRGEDRRRQSQLDVHHGVGYIKVRTWTLCDAFEVLARQPETTTPTGGEDACSGDPIERPARTEVSVVRTPEENARLFGNRVGTVERAGDPLDFTESVGEIPFGFRAPAAAGLLAAQSGKLAAFGTRQAIALRITSATDLSRETAIVARRRQWRTGPLALETLIVCEHAVFGTAVDLLIIEDQPAVLTDGLVPGGAKGSITVGTSIVCRPWISIRFVDPVRASVLGDVYRFHLL